MKGELLAELDSAKVKLSDLFTSTIYKNHYYGHSYTSSIQEVDNVTKECVIESYKNILNNSRKTLAVVGDIEADNLLEKYFGVIPESKDVESNIEPPIESKQDYAEIIKKDANQAQIIQGWRVPSISDSEYPVLMLLNTLLGASGLSSRLFLELREKKGLAYTVRSSYDVHLKSAVFSIYIGTEPSNIQTSIDGFKEEIEKIKNIKVDEKELHNAKNNLIGKQQYLSETNSQQANLYAYYSIMGKPFNYLDVLQNQIKKITSDDILNCANKYFTDNYVLTVIKP